MPARIPARSVRRALSALALLVAALPAAVPPAHAATPSWLARLNSYRVRMGLAPVAHDPRLAQGLENHSRYIVKTDNYAHGEDPGSAYYTPSGNTAGTHANITVRAGGAGSPTEDVDQWLRAPFHALGLLHPRLRSTAYESYYEARSPRYTYAAGIDVLSHRDARDSAFYPITFPAAEMVVPASMTEAADEVPDPLAPCGYADPAGLPIIFTFGTTAARPVVTASSLKRDGVPVEACATTGSSYADRTAQSILDETHSALLIPRAPLVPGRSYQASVTVSGITETVTFYVARATATIGAELTDDEVDCGDTTEIVARLFPGYGSPARQSLQLWSRPAGSNRAWQWIRSGTTDSDGQVGFDDLQPDGETEYQVRYAGNAHNEPTQSPVRTVSVVPRPWQVTTDGAHDRIVIQADSMQLTGHVFTGAADLVLERRDADSDYAWVGADVSGRSTTDGYFELSVPLGRPGRFHFRLAAQPEGCRLLGYSNPVTVTVLAASTQ